MPSKKPSEMTRDKILAEIAVDLTEIRNGDARRGTCKHVLQLVGELASRLAAAEDQNVLLKKKLVFHPTGACQCSGDGTCDWCVWTATQEENENLRTQLTATRAELSTLATSTPNAEWRRCPKCKRFDVHQAVLGNELIRFCRFCERAAARCADGEVEDR